MSNTETITGKIKISKEFLAKNKEGLSSLDGFGSLIKEQFLAEDVTKALSTVMAGAIYLDASDLHLEAEENGSFLRVRIDGLLQNTISLDERQHQSIVSRIKLLSGMKLNVDKKPQDGRFTIILEQEGREQELETRVSTLPTEYGETVVMRVLNPESLKNLEELGLRKDLYETFSIEVKKPNGMIIVTGPTGSGKTTTLYSFLNKMKSPEIKIVTIEDPIEYHLDGISQTQVDPKKGYDFASGLRSIVRQDPDVILVGEIRDLETASIALQAALTGHLVLSTLHTNDASGTIARLQALGEKPVNIAPAINMIVAQRLVRKVCPKCAEFKRMSDNDYKEMKKELDGLPKTIAMPSLTRETKLPIPKGCEECHSTGYKGRIGIFEALLIDSEAEDFILTSPSSSAIEKFAAKKGMTTMKQDGYIKIIEGTTTLEEIKRVVG